MTTQLLLTDLIIATLAYIAILMGADLIAKTIALWCECQKRAYRALQEPPTSSEATTPEAATESMETAEEEEEVAIAEPSLTVQSEPVAVERVKEEKPQESFAQMTIRELKAIALDWNRNNPDRRISKIGRLKKQELIAALEGCSC